MYVLTGHPSHHQLAAYHFESLDAEQMAAVEDHLQQCALCRNFLKRADRDDLVYHFEHPEESVTKGTKNPGMETLPSPPDARLLIPEELRDHPRYEVIKLLGEGGMGMVYRARHKMMDRDVAIKIVHARHVQSEMAVKRFHQEIRSLSKLQHPNICQAFDAENVGNLHFFVMEFIEGIDLSKLIQKKGQLPVLEACFVARQVAEALQHADEKKMIHRDLKPANLIVMKNGTVKILDFGLARFTNSDEIKEGLTSDGTVMGTPEYMAPEQGRNSKNADIRSDLYSMGVTLYQLLAGKLPFKGSPIECLISHQTEPIPPLENFRSDLPKDLIRIVNHLLEKDPAKRYQKPSEVVRDLTPFALKPKAGQPAPPPRREPITKPLPNPGVKPQPPKPPQAPKAQPAGSRTPTPFTPPILGEQAASIANDDEIAFDWDKPNKPKQKGNKSSSREPIPKTPGRETPPQVDFHNEEDRPAEPRRSPNLYADDLMKDEGPSALNRVKAQESAATTKMILLLVFLAVIGIALLYVILVVIPGSQPRDKNPDKKTEIAPMSEQLRT